VDHVVGVFGDPAFGFPGDLRGEGFFLRSVLKRSPFAPADLESEFTSLAARHTPKLGFRTYGLLHVASAVTLRCKRFTSFDVKANALAKRVGLKTN